MAHTNNIVSKIYDAINRDGFEHLMDYFVNRKGTWQYYQSRYRASSPIARLGHYAWGFAWRLALTVIPVLPALYCFTRATAVMINPFSWRKNWPKALMMTVFSGWAIVLPVVILSSAAGWSSVSSALSSVIPYASTITHFVPVGVLAVGVLVLASAFLLFAAKQAARWAVSKHNINNGQEFKITTHKHILERPEDGNELMFQAHLHATRKHIQLKTQLKEAASDLIPPAKRLSTFKKLDTEQTIRYGEETVARGKAMLSQFETVMNDNQPDNVDQGKLKLADYEALTADVTAKNPQSYSFWQAAMAKVDPSFEGTLPQISYSDDTHKMTVNSRASK